MAIAPSHDLSILDSFLSNKDQNKSINDATSDNVKQPDINESIANATRALITRQH
jgi:hypothetical protein